MQRPLGGGAPSAPPQIPSPTSTPQPPIIVLPTRGSYGANNAPTTNQPTTSEARDTNITRPTTKSNHVVLYYSKYMI